MLNKMDIIKSQSLYYKEFIKDDYTYDEFKMEFMEILANIPVDIAIINTPLEDIIENILDYPFKIVFFILDFLNFEKKYTDLILYAYDYNKITSFEYMNGFELSCIFYYMDVDRFLNILSNSPVNPKLFVHLTVDSKLFGRYLKQSIYKIKSFISKLTDDSLRKLTYVQSLDASNNINITKISHMSHSLKILYINGNTGITDDELTKLQNLQILHMRDNPKIKYLPSTLIELDSSLSHISKRNLLTNSSIKHLSKLRSLNIRNNINITDLNNLTNIENLDVSGNCGVNDIGIYHLHNIIRMNTINNQNIILTGIVLNKLEELTTNTLIPSCALLRCSNIKKLNMKNNNKITSFGPFIHYLTELDISGDCILTHALFRSLFNKNILTKLVIMDYHHSFSLVNVPKSVTELHISNISSNELSDLRGIQLKKLYVKNISNIQSMDFQCLSETLTELHIESSTLTVDCLELLNNLTVLYVDKCSGFPSLKSFAINLIELTVISNERVSLTDEHLTDVCNLKVLKLKNNRYVKTVRPFAKSLEILELCGNCQLNDNSISLCLNLKYLNLLNNYNVRDEFKRGIQERLQYKAYCEVVYE